MDLDEIDDLLELEEINIINDIYPHRQYVVRARQDHINFWNDAEFFRRFRLSKESALELLGLIEDRITSKTNRNNAVTALNKLLIALRFYATGSMYIVIGDFAGVHKTTAGKFIKEVTEAVAQLRQQFIRLPSNEEEVRGTRQKFYNAAKFPHVLGAIDCTHIKLQSPGGENSEYFRNRKGIFSLNVQAVCNAHYELTDVVARWPGATHDSNIFDNSAIRMKFETGLFKENVLLGDSGYPVRSYIIPPLSNPRTPAENLFNEAQIRTRNFIERTFGIWKRRFPILSLGIRCQIPLAQDIIIATAVLHNICRKNNEPDHNDNDIDIEEEAIEINADNRIQNDGIRREIIDYFETLL